ncbi:MAG TPA: PAS domain S-box protein [Smithellaceae bacterium]|nr:PAS domain S-box protein [Smithellaceae bacterium]
MDIRTLSVLLGITSLLQTAAIFFQYLVNRSYKGTGWWALGFASVALAFLLIILRDVISISLISIFAGNVLFLSGIMFLHVGILFFLGKKVRWGLLSFIFIALSFAFLYFIYIDDDINIRVILIAASLAAITLQTAYVLFVNKHKSITSSANFVAGVFLVFGCYFVFRAAAASTISPISSYFTPNFLQISLFLVALMTTTLMTFGLIIMVNQRLNAEMKEANEHFELLFNTSPDAALITRLQDGLIVNANAGFTAMTGYAREEAVGKTTVAIAVWSNPGDRQNVVDKLKIQGYCDNYEAVFNRKDGTAFFGLFSARIISLQGALHMASFTREITMRKQAEQAVAEKKDQLEKFFNVALDLLCIADTSGRFIRVNREWENVLGYSVAELEKRKFLDFVHPDDMAATLRAMSQLDEQNPVLNFVNRYRRQDGSYRQIEWKSYPSGNLIYAAARDITEHKLAEEKLAEEKRLLQKSLDEIKTLRGIVPICASCKKIRDDRGYWNQVEKYVSEHSEAEFSHSICPECVKKLYPGYEKD